MDLTNSEIARDNKMADDKDDRCVNDRIQDDNDNDYALKPLSLKREKSHSDNGENETKRVKFCTNQTEIDGKLLKKLRKEKVLTNGQKKEKGILKNKNQRKEISDELPINKECDKEINSIKEEFTNRARRSNELHEYPCGDKVQEKLTNTLCEESCGDKRDARNKDPNNEERLIDKNTSKGLCTNGQSCNNKEGIQSKDNLSSHTETNQSTTTKISRQNTFTKEDTDSCQNDGSKETVNNTNDTSITLCDGKLDRHPSFLSRPNKDTPGKDKVKITPPSARHRCVVPKESNLTPKIISKSERNILRSKRCLDKEDLIKSQERGRARKCLKMQIEPVKKCD